MDRGYLGTSYSLNLSTLMTLLSANLVVFLKLELFWKSSGKPNFTNSSWSVMMMVQTKRFTFLSNFKLKGNHPQHDFAGNKTCYSWATKKLLRSCNSNTPLPLTRKQGRCLWKGNRGWKWMYFQLWGESIRWRPQPNYRSWHYKIQIFTYFDLS